MQRGIFYTNRLLTKFIAFLRYIGIAMNWITILGFAAGAITTASFIPQVLKLARTHHTKDISIHMYIIITIGISLWFVYGLIMKDLPIIIANGVTLGLVMTVLYFKVRYR